MLMLSRSMQSLCLATVLCITIAVARNVPEEEEAAEVTNRRAPSWTAKVSHKHMCSWCNGKMKLWRFHNRFAFVKYVDI